MDKSLAAKVSLLHDTSKSQTEPIPHCYIYLWSVFEMAFWKYTYFGLLRRSLNDERKVCKRLERGCLLKRPLFSIAMEFKYFTLDTLYWIAFYPVKYVLFSLSFFSSLYVLQHCIRALVLWHTIKAILALQSFDRTGFHIKLLYSRND